MKNKGTPPSNKGNPVAKHMRTFNKATVQRDRKKDDKRGYSKHSKTYESAEEFVPHDMFHPETGEKKRADSKATHLVLKARGWTHSKNESVEQVDEDYFSVQFYDAKGKVDSSSKSFKDQASAKKYLAKANATTKVGSYKMHKVQGRMESVEQVDESKETKKQHQDALMKLHALKGTRFFDRKKVKYHELELKKLREESMEESVEQVDEKVVPYNKELLARMIDLVQDYLVDISSHGDITEKDYKSAMAVIKKIAGDKVAAEVSSDKAISKLLYGRHRVSGTDIMRDRQGLSGRKKNKSGKLSKVSMSNFKKDVEDAMSRHQKVTRKLPESVDNAKSEKDSARMKLRHANQKVRLAKKQERENDRVSEDADDPNSSAKKPMKFKKPDGTTGVKMVPAHQDVQTEACWDSHKQVGTKKKGGKTVPNCVPKESSKLSELSNDKVHNYLSKSMHQSDDAKSRGDSKLRAKREKGIRLGLKKQTGTAKVASTESYQQVLEASSNYLSKDDLPAKVKRVVINIFKLAKKEKKKIARLSVELVSKKYYVYVELGRDNNEEEFVSRMMDMETGREKFLEIHPSASVHPAPNVSIREAVQQVDEGVLNDIRDFIVAVGAAIPTKKNKRNAKDKALEDQIRMAMEADPEFDKIVRSVVFVRKDGVAAFKQGGRDKLDKYVHKTVDAKVAAKLGTLVKGHIRTMASGETRNLGQNPRFNKGEKKAKEQGKIVYGDDMYMTRVTTTQSIGKIIKQVAKRAYDDAKKEQKNESVEQVEEGRKLVLNINPKWSMKEVNREIKDTTQEIKQGQADHKRRPMNPTQADQHWQRKHYLEKLVALKKKKKSLGEETMSDSISGNWGKVNEALSDVVVKKMQDMVGGPKNMPRGPEFRALKAKAQAAVAAEKKAKKSAPKAKTTTKTAKGKTHKGSADASDRNIIMQLRIAQDSMNHGDKTGDVLVSPTRTVALSKGKIDALLKKHDALQKPVDKRKFVVLMTKALRKLK